jgi:hypothetical protein
MLKNVISGGSRHSNFTIMIVQVIVLGLITIPLNGCSDDGQGGPTLSSLSTPTDAPSGDGALPDSNPTETETPAGEDMVATSPEEDSTASVDEELDLAATLVDPAEVDPAEMEKVAISMTGATVRVTWDASSDPNVQGYFVHYGKRSPGEYGSCSYEESQRVGSPPATITGLEPNTVYFFAISAFGEAESEAETPCSNEITVVTPSVQS